MQGEMQAELNKVVGALKEFYARETHLFERDLGERTLTHRLAVQVEKQFSGMGSRLRLQQAGRTNTAAAQGNDCEHRR
jgi:hypothetical protein